MAAALLAAVLCSGCVANRAVHHTESVNIGGVTYEVQRVIEAAPGDGAWVGRVESARGQSVSYSIAGQLRPGALDALFVGVLEGSTLDAAGNFFSATPAPHPGPGGQAFQGFGLTGTIPFHETGRTVLVAWSGLEANATIRLGLPAGLSFAQEGRSESGVELAPWTMGDDGNLLVHSGHKMSSAVGPMLFWGDLSVSRLGRGNVTLTADGTTHSQAIQGSSVPTIQRFAAIARPGEVRVDYSLAGIGDDPGLYGALIRLPAFVSEHGWLEAAVCGICT